MKSFKDLIAVFDSGTAQEQKELAAKLRVARLADDARQENDPEECRARGRECVRLRTLAFEERDRKAKELAEAEAEFRRASEKLQALHGDMNPHWYTFSAYVDDLRKWALAGRPALLDILQEQLESEACFHPIELAQFTPGKYSDRHPQGFSNEASVNARRAALRLLKQRLQTAVETCEVATAEELQKLHDQEYKKLPKAEPIKSVLAKSEDPRAAEARPLGNYQPQPQAPAPTAVVKG